jgi:ribonuclease E
MLENEPGAAGNAAPQSDAVLPATDSTETTTRRVRRRTTKAAAAAEPPAEPAVEEPAAPTRRRRKAAEPVEAAQPGEAGVSAQEATEAAPRRRTSRRAAAAPPAAPAAASAQAAEPAPAEPATTEPATTGPATTERARATTRRARAARAAAEPPAEAEPPAAVEPPAKAPARGRRLAPAPAVVLFMPPEAVVPEPAIEEPAAEGRPARRRARSRRTPEPVEAAAEPVEEEALDEADEDEEIASGVRRRRRRGRRGRGRGKGPLGEEIDDDEEPEEAEAEAVEEAADEDAGAGLTRRRRRRRRKGAADAEAAPDEPYTVVKIREPRTGRDEVQGVTGSTRLEAKRQRRRDGREQRRTRPPILSESEFLARREAVDRVMVVRERGDRTQIAVLEDGVLVEHYVTRASASTMTGNVYLGRVQNVLPSMEAAFVDIGRGRNAVLYAGEVNWDTTGLEGRTRTIEQAMKSGDAVLVQVTKDPIGTKGARLTSHVALSGRHLVYVPHGNASGISRKLSDVERKRLRDVLKNLVPDGAGVIVRTAAEGASEDELARDVKRLQAQWEDIQAKAAEGNAPALLYEEPDLVIRVVRDLFNEDFRELVIQGGGAFDMVEPYLAHVSPDLVSRVRRHVGPGDVFAEMRVDEQILKGLDRKVFLSSGGHLVIDRTEAMTVIDVNTGKYTGAGGNLEETVTRNNLEAAEEIVRQLRLRDFGGIIVIDFIDMVLESNRELVLRRLTECLGRDRTKHQVTEITSLGLVQMTRKRVGQGLLEAFSEVCEVCKGRGLIIHTEPIAERRGPVRAIAPVAEVEETQEGTRGSRRRGRRGAPSGAEPAAAELDEPAELVPTEAVDDTDDLDEPATELRRRTRRGGARRRTRP